jgi:DNA invertase Pin-like site-specific DNA recombinase
VDLTSDEAASAAERLDCPTCGVPAGSACRTRSGNTAIKYHTARFILVPELRDKVEVDVPDDRGPGRPWRAGPPVELRIGYAHCPTASGELAGQLGALEAARCGRIFAEQVSASVKRRPELDKALALARELAQTTPERPTILTVPELKSLARNTIELTTLAATLQTDGVRLEVLTGPLAGIHNPDGTVFTVLAAAAQLDRDHLRDKTLEGQRIAAARGNHSGRPKVFDDDMLARARALRDEGVPVPEIATRLTISNGKNAGQHPSVASVYRVLVSTSDERSSHDMDEAGRTRAG